MGHEGRGQQIHNERVYLLLLEIERLIELEQIGLRQLAFDRIAGISLVARSASRFLSFAFSSSRGFRRLAPDTSMPKASPVVPRQGMGGSSGPPTRNVPSLTFTVFAAGGDRAGCSLCPELSPQSPVAFRLARQFYWIPPLRPARRARNPPSCGIRAGSRHHARDGDETWTFHLRHARPARHGERSSEAGWVGMSGDAGRRRSPAYVSIQTLRSLVIRMLRASERRRTGVDGRKPTFRVRTLPPTVLPPFSPIEFHR